jgi:hypothetical protein
MQCPHCGKDIEQCEMNNSPQKRLLDRIALYPALNHGRPVPDDVLDKWKNELGLVN